MIVEFTVDCPKCGSEASAGRTLFRSYVPGETLVIDLGMHGAQMEFTCIDDECGVTCYSGDYEVYTE